MFVSIWLVDFCIYRHPFCQHFACRGFRVDIFIADIFLSTFWHLTIQSLPIVCLCLTTILRRKEKKIKGVFIRQFSSDLCWLLTECLFLFNFTSAEQLRRKYYRWRICYIQVTRKRKKQTLSRPQKFPKDKTLHLLQTKQKRKHIERQWQQLTGNKENESLIDCQIAATVQQLENVI